MAPGDTGAGVDGHVASGEDVLPAPFRRCLPIFPFQRMGKVDCPMALRQILLMQGFDPGEVVLEERGERRRKGRKASLSPFPERTVSCFIETSMSLTRSRTASIIRKPLP